MTFSIWSIKNLLVVQNQTARASNAVEKDSKEVIYNFSEAHLQLDRPRGKIDFQSRPRPIIARFLRYGDKQLVMDRARKYLKNIAFNVYDDILKPLCDLRKGQLRKGPQ